ncbi:MAG: epoxyqueuosine reductase [Ruminococcaceae bacterium]|nr:epoxyqueuosine reductase [Oscillospiraceae bacterium]
MEKSQIVALIQDVFRTFPGNAVPEQEAIRPELAGMVLFEAPLVGFADAADPIFETYQQEGVVGPWHMLPQEWLPGAKTVISMFFPFTEEVKEGERRAQLYETSAQWLHGRIEGQNYLVTLFKEISRRLTEAGVDNCVPCYDPRFKVGRGRPVPGFDVRTYGSTWSERHAAYACGLGTFGLSKGIITEKGMAGRLGSIIVDAEMEVEPRPYTGVYDYCTRCGACVKRCPAKAIEPETGKNHDKCAGHMDWTEVAYAPRYGCGKCQTCVPCESRNPSKK